MAVHALEHGGAPRQKYTIFLVCSLDILVLVAELTQGQREVLPLHLLQAHHIEQPLLELRG
jgi:hypothetical protein